MKRGGLAVLVILMILALCAPALAEKEYYGTMMVDHCNEWVSLRDGPGTGCNRLAKVPLYAIVTDAEWDPFCGDFIYCNYDGQFGYILAEYLEPWADPEPEEGLDFDVTLNGLRVMAERTMTDGGESMRITCEDEQGATRWSYETMTEYVTELDPIAVFLGGAAQDPMVMVYNSEYGLTALDFFSGEERWKLDESLGASITWAVDGEGNAYIGGYYGPDPVCVDVYGHVKWRSDSEGCYWLYAMEIVDGRLYCWYDMLDGESNGRVIFSLDGELLEKTME